MPLNATPAIVSIFALTIGTLTPPARGQDVCTLGTINEINDILPICCGSTGSDQCAAGMPPRCSPECAELLVPFWETCSGLMQIMGASTFDFDVQALSDFIVPCSQWGVESIICNMFKNKLLAGNRHWNMHGRVPILVPMPIAG